MEAVNKQALRILRLFGNTTAKRVTPSVGAEQEYFLVDKEKWLKRKDLIYTGRTLFGAMPPKGQEMDDHYLGTIRQRVSAYMKEVNEECWKLGVAAKTQHNEVAPAQHELAPIYAPVNIAQDHNQIMMRILKKVASRHGMRCLLHEKPFAGVNGSGKHNNWSLGTDTGTLLMAPGKTPEENLRFITFIVNTLMAVYRHNGLLKASIMSATNAHRLGANEAPPAIISSFLGSQLSKVLDHMEDSSTDELIALGGKHGMKLDIPQIPELLIDNTDRNRTSPFAFTGNKFEFRMPGSAENLSDANTILNTAVAKELKGYADDFALLQKVEELGLPMVMERKHSDTPMCANVDMYSGLVYAMLGIPEEVFTPLFASARIAGWCANRIEEVVTCHRIMRPAYRAVTTHEAYIPMDQRGEHLHLSAAD